MRIGRVISGGQTGVDQAALRAAAEAGIPTGGWAPKGWITECGPMPSLADFGLKEWNRAGYTGRTRANIETADTTFILWQHLSDLTGGTALTQEICTREVLKNGKPVTSANICRPEGRQLVWWAIESLAFGGTINVAGPRESKSPGIGAAAYKFLLEMFMAARDSA